MKVKTGLSLFTISLTTIMLIMLLTGSIFIARNLILENIENHLWTTVQSRANHIEALLSDYKNIIGMMTTGYIYQNALDEKLEQSKYLPNLKNRIEITKDNYPEIEKIRVLDKNGLIIASTSSDIGTDKSNSSIFIKAKENIYLGGIHKSKVTGNIVMCISAPIFVRGDFVGVIDINFLAEYNLYKLLLDKTGLGKTGKTYLVNKDSYLISPSLYKDSTFLETKVHSKQVSLCFSEHLEKGLTNKVHATTFVYSDYSNRSVIGAHYFIPEMQWALIGEIDVEEVYQPINDLIYYVIIGFLVLFALTIIISIILTNNIISPIKDLHKGTDEIIKGNLKHKVGTKRKDEIGQLSRAFDIMTERLTHSQIELQKYTDKLEDKVKKRTFELEAELIKSEKNP